jgi:choline dehydrogenase-like flavoprotein
VVYDALMIRSGAAIGMTADVLASRVLQVLILEAGTTLPIAGVKISLGFRLFRVKN